MGLLDIVGSVISSQMNGNTNQQHNLLSEVGQLVDNMGGVQNILSKFEQGGLGGLVSSWVGTGANQDVSTQQISSTLGDDTIANIASKLGLSQGAAASGIASILPQLIDHLTPQGSVTNDQSTLETGLSTLMKLLK